MLLLRLSWGRPHRAAWLNIAAWAAMLVGAAGGWADSGAWGVAIVTLAAMAVAMLLLAQAALVAPAGRTRVTRRTAVAAAEPRRLGGRLLGFLMVVPLAFAAALLVALGARAVAAMAGWAEANSNMLCLMLMPLLWALLAFALLYLPRRRDQWLILAVPAAVAGLILWTGAPA